MPGQPGAIRESRVESRPRNPEVEKAWDSYVTAWDVWQDAASRATAYKDPEATVKMTQTRAIRDEMLFTYFEAFDKDQNGQE